MTLRRKTFSAIRWTSTAATIRALLQLGQLALLARLLSPEDYGLMAMVGVVLSLAGLFSDLGINGAYVQRQQITPEQRSSLFWLNLLASVGVTCLVIAASPLLAGFFNDARLAPLMMLSASTIFLSALSQQVRMTAEKELDFRPLAILEICAALMGFVTAVLAAFSGWGVYSLVASGIVSALVATILAWSFVARDWRPQWHLRLVDVRSFLGFGGSSVGNGIVSQINLTIDILLGGHFLTAAQLGLYTVPRNLTLQLQFMINPIVTRVGFPMIAQVQSDIARVRTIYLKTMNMTASINAPLYVGTAFFAQEIVYIMLGNGWSRSAELLTVLALWGGLRSTGNPVGSLLFGMGRADLALKWNLGLSIFVVSVMWLTSQSGPEDMAWALLGIQIAFFIPGWYFLIRPLCHAGLAEYSISALKPFALSGLSVAPAYMVAMHFDGPLIRLAIGVTIAIPLYFAISFKGNREWVLAMMELVGRRTSVV